MRQKYLKTRVINEYNYNGYACYRTPDTVVINPDKINTMRLKYSRTEVIRHELVHHIQFHKYGSTDNPIQQFLFELQAYWLMDRTRPLITRLSSIKFKLMCAVLSTMTYFECKNIHFWNNLFLKLT